MLCQNPANAIAQATQRQAAANRLHKQGGNNQPGAGWWRELHKREMMQTPTIAATLDLYAVAATEKIYALGWNAMPRRRKHGRMGRAPDNQQLRP